jgi:hypothetical protein
MALMTVIFTCDDGTRIVLDERSQSATFLCLDGAQTVSLETCFELIAAEQERRG